MANADNKCKDLEVRDYWKEKEYDVKAHLEYLQNALLNAKMHLKEYKKQIETYRSEIAAMQRALETLNNDNLK